MASAPETLAPDTNPPLRRRRRTLLGACLGAALYQQRSFRLAVVIKPEAVVRYGWLDVSQTAFSVHDGAELQVLDQNNDWLQVTAGPLRLGWYPP